MNPPTTKQKAPVSGSETVFHIPVIKLRQADGSLLVKAGKPELVEAEISVAQFHKRTDVSKRHIATLCEQGLIQHRRLTPKNNSKILIPVSEVNRFRKLTDDPGMAAKTSLPVSGRGSAAENASYPVAKRGEAVLNLTPNLKNHHGKRP